MKRISAIGEEIIITLVGISAFALLFWGLSHIKQDNKHNVVVNHTNTAFRAEIVEHVHKPGDYIWINPVTEREDNKNPDAILCKLLD